MRNLNGARVQLFQVLVSSSREHQKWLHLPCGRIVLAAVPQLCLSAAHADDGAVVHIWQKVNDDHKNKHLQIWEVTEDKRIRLASHPSLHLDIGQELTCPKGHSLQVLGKSSDNGWACDGRKSDAGCKSGITGFKQTSGMYR